MCSASGREALGQVGAIFETPSFYGYLSGRQNLEIFCSYSAPVPRRRSTSRRAGAAERAHRRSGDASIRTACGSGWRWRRRFCRGPRVLILDEPSEGLDPEGIYEMRELIRQLHRDFQLTILICSHLLAEVEQICPKVAIMRNGRLLFHGDWRARRAGPHAGAVLPRDGEGHRGMSALRAASSISSC